MKWFYTLFACIKIVLTYEQELVKKKTIRFVLFFPTNIYGFQVVVVKLFNFCLYSYRHVKYLVPCETYLYISNNRTVFVYH